MKRNNLVNIISVILTIGLMVLTSKIIKVNFIYAMFSADYDGYASDEFYYLIGFLVVIILSVCVFLAFFLIREIVASIWRFIKVES